MLLLNAALRVFNRPVQQRMFEFFAFLQAKLLHDAGDAVRTEQSHQIVFQ